MLSGCEFGGGSFLISDGEVDGCFLCCLTYACRNFLNLFLSTISTSYALVLLVMGSFLDVAVGG